MKSKKKKTKLSLSRKVYMEDIECISASVYDALNKRDIWFNSVTSDDSFHKSLMEFLQERFDYPDYKIHD